MINSSSSNTIILIGNLDLGHLIDILNYLATPTPEQNSSVFLRNNIDPQQATATTTDSSYQLPPPATAASELQHTKTILHEIERSIETDQGLIKKL